MIRLLLQLIGFSQRAAQEPLDKRRRIAFAALAVSLPVILALWALSLRYSLSGYQSAEQAAPLPLAEGKEAFTQLQRGLANFRMIMDELWGQMQYGAEQPHMIPEVPAAISAPEEEKTGRQEERVERLYPLPIVE
jgi:hypothetical protein